MNTKATIKNITTACIVALILFALLALVDSANTKQDQQQKLEQAKAEASLLEQEYKITLCQELFQAYSKCEFQYTTEKNLAGHYETRVESTCPTVLTGAQKLFQEFPGYVEDLCLLPIAGFQDL